MTAAIDATAPALRASRSSGVLSKGRVAGAMALVLAGLLVFAYFGATTPKATWFGTAVSHGPRDVNEVALTFDDGPDIRYTPEVASILQAHGVRATFFVVGKALDARPDIAASLMAEGHELGDHSYHHDSLSWLRPDYPEIALTQRAVKRQLGVCPALFRPPHGARTPLVTRKASRAGMRTVTWDVSGGDWATTNADLVARRVLSRVRPGSIILLHDGLDGRLEADRSVLVTALPFILQGLEDRGLKAVPLSKLLGVQPYTDQC